MTPVDPLQPFLEDQGVVVLDGALATELERRAADLRDELWSARLLIEDPGLISQLHLDYFLAGADVAISASYQSSFEGFARRGLNRRESAELLRSSVRIAQQARDKFWNELQDPTERVGRRRPLVAAELQVAERDESRCSEIRSDRGRPRAVGNRGHRNIALAVIVGLESMAAQRS